MSDERPAAAENRPEPPDDEQFDMVEVWAAAATLAAAQADRNADPCAQATDDQRPYVQYAADAALEEAEAIADFLADLRAHAAELRERRAAGDAGGVYVLGPREVLLPTLGSPEAAAWLAEPVVVEELLMRRRPDGTIEVLGTEPGASQKEGGK